MTRADAGGPSSRSLAAAFGAATVILSLVFVLAPGLDLAVSALPFDEAAAAFPRLPAGLELLRNLGRLAVPAVAAILLVIVGLGRFVAAGRWRLDGRSVAYLLGVLAIGPGLLVQGLLKGAWGRARPRDIVEFGGDEIFSAAWYVSDQCATNCSFVSGEAAAAAWSFAFAALVAGPWRTRALALAGVWSATFAGLRLAAGAHFLSDCLLGLTLTATLAFGLHARLFEGPRRSEQAVGSSVE